MMSGFLQVLVDVRTKSEFDAGHIENATLVESLALAGTSSEITNWTALDGCQDCNIAVYCRSGARADTALSHLEQNGFVNLFDAAGINQWKGNLVTGSAATARCTLQPALRTCEVREGEVGNTTGCPGEATGDCPDDEENEILEEKQASASALASKAKSRLDVHYWISFTGLLLASAFFFL